MSVAVFVLAAHLATAAPAEPIQFKDHADVAADDVRIDDVANLSALPPNLRTRAGRQIVLRLGPSQNERVLSQDALRDRIFALMPALGPWLPSASGGVVIVRRPSKPLAKAAMAMGCVKAQAPLAIGDYPIADDLAPAACPDKVDHALVYDHMASVVRAARDVQSGEVIAGVPKWAIAQLSPGAPAYLETVAGPIKIERLVHVAQPARLGHGFFARAQDGGVVPAPALGGEQ
jgi:hypothetical protein